MEYLFARNLHLACVLLSVTLFLLRGGLMLVGSPWLQARPFRIVPHVVDAVLLASAIWLSVLVRQYPFVNGWLTAKVLALVVYIVLGSVALKRGRNQRVRTWALAGALLTLAYILAAARTHDAWLGLG